MPQLVRKAYANCTAKDPTRCRFHGKQFFKDPALAKYASMKDLLFRSETEVIASSILETEKEDVWEFINTAQKLKDNLTLEEIQVLHLYCDEFGSRVIAWYLNGTITNHHLESPEEIYRRVAILDRIIAKHPLEEKPRMLYRGLKEFYSEWGDLEVGKTVNIKSYSSTSSSLQTAKDFVNGEAPILLKINTRKGAPIHANFLEHEYLLPRNLTLKVTAVEENVLIKSGMKEHPGYTVVTLDEVE